MIIFNGSIGDKEKSPACRVAGVNDSASFGKGGSVLSLLAPDTL